MVLRPNLFTLQRLDQAAQLEGFRFLAEKIGVMGEATALSLSHGELG